MPILVWGLVSLTCYSLKLKGFVLSFLGIIYVLQKNLVPLVIKKYPNFIKKKSRESFCYKDPILQFKITYVASSFRGKMVQKIRR
jgi:hypothetical protein